MFLLQFAPYPSATIQSLFLCCAYSDSCRRRQRRTASSRPQNCNKMSAVARNDNAMQLRACSTAQARAQLPTKYAAVHLSSCILKLLNLSSFSSSLKKMIVSSFVQRRLAGEVVETTTARRIEAQLHQVKRSAPISKFLHQRGDFLLLSALSIRCSCCCFNF